MTPYRLKAKIDRGLALMIYALIVASALPLLFSPGWYFVAIHVLLIILTTDMLYGTHYTINDQYLVDP